MDVPAGLLAAADQVYAGLLDDALRSFDGLELDPAAFPAEFERRLRAMLDPQQFHADPGEPAADDPGGD